MSADSHDPETRPSDDADVEPRRIERLLLPYFTESTLWPVTIVLLATLSLFGAAILLMAFHDRNVFAMAALAILAVGSVEGLVRSLRRRRVGAVGFLVLALWLLAALIAFAAARYGLF